MAVRLFFALIALLTIANIYVLFSSTKQEHLNVGTKEFPTLQFYDVTAYTMDVNSTKSVLSAKKVERYSDKDILYKPILRINPLKDERLSADTGIKTEQMLYLKNNVVYFQGEDLNITSHSADYALDTRLLTCNAPFVLYQKDNKVEGKSAWVDVERKKLEATHIQATLYTE